MYNSLNNEENPDRLEVVIRLYEMGFNLLPAKGSEKRPTVRYKKYQTERVEHEVLSGWLKKFRPQNLVLMTGATPWTDLQNGIVVLDADDEESEQLILNRVPPTPMMQTSGKGKHFVFRHPGFHVGSPPKIKVDGIKYNLDIRADGAVIMCPGSIHPATNKVYAESKPWDLGLLEQAPVYDPSWLNIASGKKTSVLINAEFDGHDDLIDSIEMSVDERETIATDYLAGVKGTKEGEGAERCVFALTMEILYGFALPADKALILMSEWGQRKDQMDQYGDWYPWDQEDLQRKIDDCLKETYRGKVGDKLVRVLDPKNHLKIAKLFFKSQYTDDNHGTLAHFHDKFYEWSGNCYQLVIEADIRSQIYGWLDKCNVRVKDKDEEKIVSFAPNRNIVSGIVDALKAVANQSSNLTMPCWLDRSDNKDIIAFDNGLFDVETRQMSKHTPTWFSVNCLPHEHDHVADCPEWKRFLSQVLDEDDERIKTLQQWFGYNLIDDISQHKFVLLYGPPRSGKGTILDVLSAMLGEHNVAHTPLSELGSEFGLEPLVGKMAVLIDEGHLGRFSNGSRIVERIKSVVGGSNQMISRKNISNLPNVKLSVRFTMAMNEIPRLADSSTALATRMIVIPVLNSYVGKEDLTLSKRLLTEMSGITNWALDGLVSLQNQGLLINPSAGEEILREFGDLSFPISSFVNECCLIGTERSVVKTDLQLAWKNWCSDNGHHAGSNADFSKKLRSVVPRLNEKRPTVSGKRIRVLHGVGLSNDSIDSVKTIKLVG